jgi:hypothetical protein
MRFVAVKKCSGCADALDALRDGLEQLSRHVWTTTRGPTRFSDLALYFAGLARIFARTPRAARNAVRGE